MEFNLSSIEKSYQSIHTSEDTHNNQANSGHANIARSYSCTFCKRGFSNAQALGGHMNIHRKDRARLKEFPEGNQIQTLILDDTSSTHVESYEEKSTGSTTRLPVLFSKDDDDVSRGKDGIGEGKQLYLFVDKHHDQSSSENIDSERKGKGLQSQGSSHDHEVDLELRLGMDQP